MSIRVAVGHRLVRVSVPVLAAVWLFAQSALAAPAASSCAPEILGTWKLESTTQPDTTLLSFTREGWANVLSGPADQPVDRYEIIAQVSYRFAPTRDPKRLEFDTRRGNDVFAAGRSRWEIVAYSDQSLTTHAAEAAAGAQMLWSRVTAQRYFLTLAARDGTPQRPAAAVVMWTTQSSKTELEALGTMGEGMRARLGRIPLELAQELSKPSARTEDISFRIELNEAEYLRTHRVLEAWDGVLRNDGSAGSELAPQMPAVLDATVQSINRCYKRLRVPARAMQSPQAWIRELRRLNEKK